MVIADAIRFGNGMGTVDQGGGVSGYPREDENMRYWVRANLGQGQSTSLYNGSGDDESDSWSAPGKMSAEMNREQSGDIHDRIHIAFHSNCCSGRGCVGLITGDATPNQSLLAQIGGQEVIDLRCDARTGDSVVQSHDLHLHGRLRRDFRQLLQQRNGRHDFRSRFS